MSTPRKLSNASVSIVSIAPLVCADPKTHKGQNTFEWRLPDKHQITVYFRDAGEDAGGHYHEGTDPSKDPELFLLLTGVVTMRFIDSDAKETICRLDATKVPTMITIPPRVLHYFKAETDISYIEYRITPFDPDKSDCHSPADFYSKVLSM